MNRLEVQEFLRTRSFGELEEEWGVCARVSKDGHKFSLNYDMISWTPGHRPTERCRGLVLATVNGRIPNTKGKPGASFVPGETIVLAYPMDKFYNSEEHHAAKIDWSDAGLKVFDKLDGTLAILYWDSIINEWHVATRSVPEADLPIDGFANRTFRTLFEEGVLETTGLHFSAFTSTLDKFRTYCFELTSPYNRIMVEYKKPGITLLATRSNVTFQELDITFGGQVPGVPTPQTWSLTTPQQISEFVNALSPVECEGAVVMDSHFRRIKIKSMKWIVANSAKTTLGASPRNLVRYVLQGVDDDVRALLPETMQSRLDETREQIHQIFTTCDSNVKQWKELAVSRKNFAEMVNVYDGWQGPAFKLYEGKFNTTWEFVQSLLKSDKLSDTFIDGILKHVRMVGSDDQNVETSLPD